MIKDFICIKLKFNAPLLFAAGTKNYTHTSYIIHSDTIKSALFVENLNLKNPISDALTFFKKFKISSSFVFYKDTFFLPRLSKKLNIKFKKNNIECPDTEIRKERKNIQWLDKTLFENEINNKISEVEISHLIQGKFLFHSLPDFDSIDNLIYEEIISRVKYNLFAENDPFDVARYHFHQDAGLYFLVETLDIEPEKFLNEILFPTFQMIGLNGIGGYKTIGHGTFEPQLTKLSLQIPEQPNALTNLSNYLPSKSEFDSLFSHPEYSEKLSYSLIKRTGYIASAQDINLRILKKKSIYMFKTGSIFPYLNNEHPLNGQIQDVTPNDAFSHHKVFKDGTGIFLPIIFDESKS
jgi:CRISPR type III-A-associated RAMP protein Csm4